MIFLYKLQCLRKIGKKYFFNKTLSKDKVYSRNVQTDIKALEEPPLHTCGTDSMTFPQLLIQFSLIHFAFLQVCRAVGDFLHLFNAQSLRTHGTHLLRFQQPGHTNHTDYHTTMQLTS